MSTYARVSGGIVAELFTPPDGVAITDCFHSDLTWIDVTSDPPQQNWIATDTDDVWSFAAPPAPPALTLAQQAAVMLADGCAITSTGTPALNGTYAIDSDTRNDVMAEMLSVVVNGTFTNGTTTLLWPDMSPAMHSFSIVDFKAFASAIGAFVGALKAIAATDAGTLPTQPTTIA